MVVDAGAGLVGVCGLGVASWGLLFEGWGLWFVVWGLWLRDYIYGWSSGLSIWVFVLPETFEESNTMRM